MSDERPQRPDGPEDASGQPDDGEDAGRRQLLAAGAIMAAGTVVSRLSGLIRSVLLAAALGLGLHAEVFNIANTVPNMLYILLAGGVFNAVLVPQLIRSMKNDDDGGTAYVDRILTAAALFLGVVSLLLVVGAPVVASVYLDSTWDQPALAADRESVVAFVRYCVPQVFFYGMFVLVGQVLNARGRFGPMMWAPIANNLIAIGVLVTYLLAYGPYASGHYSTGQELLLGLGSTFGIAMQLLVLVPSLRAAGVRYRPRFDLRGTGLGHTLRLGWWTVLFVIVNQIAYWVVVNRASSGTTTGEHGTGYTVYSNAFLIAMVPHSVVTVSLATAILPRLSQAAADADLGALSRQLGSTVRLVLSAILPFAALLPVLAPEIASVLYRHGAAAATYTQMVPSLALFGAGIVFFTVHYLMLRGFYALEQTRTVFFIQCGVAATNIAAALLLVRFADPQQTAPALVLAYIASYVVGSLLSVLVLARRVGGLGLGALTSFVARLMVASAVAVVVAGVVSWGLHAVLGGDPSWPVAGVIGLVVVLVGGGTVLLLARPLGLSEVGDLISSFTGRLAARRRR